ncbi:hypothetical protein ACFQ3P_24550 [Paraburkholderia sabiae]|jgi:hypothetical protein|uniref:UrcA family protein n=1 Tax=Paraburkholderia sabiae TaxID=273251 RepID=A0ABU9QPJ2_9BURK|nr:hypothetical protein [Paraburkholderia sabiae]WJZ76318.1 hypothetical protein QEN71_11075 [Paraburkholderia sabiae]CAD6550770.1 hypothetical protein LMG24235_04864 [Paraburkholderia sabiae]CAG9215938.1 conserved exported hypothetical protein [Paraburkholderia sabiae]
MQFIPGVMARVAALVPVTCATLLATQVRAESTCPDYVVLPSGSAFNIARLIKDAGSPQAALDKARSAVEQVSSNGGCPRSVKRAVCEETMTVAKKAIAALEGCVGPSGSSLSDESDRRTASR